MTNGKLVLSAVLLLLLFSVASEAQVVPQATTGWAGAAELRVVGGYSPRSNKAIGVTEHRKLIYTAVEYVHPIGHFGGTTVSYMAGLVPFIAVQRPAETILGTTYPAGTSWGAGATPIGFQFTFRPGARLEPFAELAGGLAYFNEQVPIANSSQFNFMAHWGGGIEFYHQHSHWLTIGYRYHHLSNANTGQLNPGIDSNLIYVAIPIWRRTRVK